MISDVCSTLLSAIACGSVLLAVLSILVLAVFALPKALVRKCAGIAEKLSRIWRIHPAPLSLFIKDNCYQVIIYCAGMNDCNPTNAVAAGISVDWQAGVSKVDEFRSVKGRTLFVALKIPELSSAYSLSGIRNRTIYAVNAGMDFISANPFFKFILGDTAQIPHANDDGMHFSDVGYSIMADRIYSAIIEGLGDD